MSAWFIWGSLGFYPLSGSSTFIIGAPLFNNVTIPRSQGDINVIAYNQGVNNFFVKQVTINKQVISVPYFDYSLIANGATIEFWMSSTQTDFGRSKIPYSI